MGKHTVADFDFDIRFTGFCAAACVHLQHGSLCKGYQNWTMICLRCAEWIESLEVELYWLQQRQKMRRLNHKFERFMKTVFKEGM